MKNIVVYSTPTCPYCTMVKDYLRDRNLYFEDKNISSNTDAAKEVVDLTQQMEVPVTVIDQKYVIGFNTDKLDTLLNNN